MGRRLMFGSVGVAVVLFLFALGQGPAYGDSYLAGKLGFEVGGIEGTVTVEGFPMAIPGIQVELYSGEMIRGTMADIDVGEKPLTTTITDANGHYAFPGLLVSPLGGPYLVRFVDTHDPANYAPRIWQNATYFLQLGTPISPTANATVTANATMTNPCTVVAQVQRLGHPGWGLSNKTLDLVWMSELPGEAWVTTTTTGGTQWIQGLSPGQWRVRCSDPAGSYGAGICANADLSIGPAALASIVVSMPLLPTTTSDITSAWHRSPSLVSLIATGGDLPPYTTRYSIAGSPSVAYTGPFGVSGDGTVTVAWSSADSAGNREVTKTANVLLDNAPPVTTTNADGGSHQFFAQSSTDAQSGVKTRHYRINGSTPATYTQPIMLHGGTFAIEAWSEDNAGNVESPHATGTIVNSALGVLRGTMRRPDGSPLPGMAVGIQVPGAGPFGMPQGWAGAGQTKADGSWECTGVVPGPYYVWTNDTALNWVGYYNDHAFYYQNATTVTVSAGATATLDMTATPAASLTVYVRRTGTQMRAAGAQVSLDHPEGVTHGGWGRTTDATGTSVIRGLPPGAYKLTVSGVPNYLTAHYPDSVGGVWTQGEGENKTITLDLDPVQPIWIDADIHRLGGAHEALPGLSLLAEEASGTGVVATRTPDAGGAAEFAKLPAGRWRLSASDPAHLYETVWAPGPGASDTSVLTSGTVATWHLHSALLPVTATNFDPVWHRSGSAVVTFTVTAGDRAVAHTYAWVGGVRSEVTTSLVVSGEGTADVSFGSIDASGSAETTRHVFVLLDSRPPTTTATLTGGPRAACTLAVVDPASGVAWTHIRVDGGAETTYTGPVVTTTSGAHYVEFWSVDVAGNAEAHRFATVVNTPPVKFGALSAPKSVKKNKKFTVGGTIWPKQKTGTRTTKLRAYRLVGSAWVYTKSFTTSSKPSGSKSRFSGSVKLGVKGKWRLVARSPGYAHRWRADSAPRYVTVK